MDIAKEIIFAEKNLISDEGFSSAFATSDKAYPNLVSVASIYGKPPDSFSGIKKEFDDLLMEEEDEEEYENEEEDNMEGDIPEN